MRGQKILGMAGFGLVLVGLVGGCPPPTGGGTIGETGNSNSNGNVNDNDNGAGSSITANAGIDQAVTGGAAVNLDGSNTTSDLPLTYSWVQTAGTAVELVGADTTAPSFTAPNTNETLTFTLTIEPIELALIDEAVSIFSDTVDVVVSVAPSMLFVVNNGAPMTSYLNPSQLDGEIAPTNRLDLGAATSLFQPRAIVVTESERLLIGRQNGGIVEYEGARTVDGVVAGVTVDGSATFLDAPVAFAYEDAVDRLFVGNVGATDGILVFEGVSADGFTGNLMPTRRFGPDDRVPFNTNTTSLVMTIDAMDLDARGNLYVSDTSGQNVNTSRILFFASPETDEGTAIVSRSFTSVWGGIEDFVVDDNDALYVVDSTATICVFRDVTNLDGIVQPDALVTVGVTRADLQGIVVDRNGTAYVADRENDAVYAIDDLLNTPSGTVLPDRTLSGFETRLASPRQMFLLEP